MILSSSDTQRLTSSSPLPSPFSPTPNTKTATGAAGKSRPSNADLTRRPLEGSSSRGGEKGAADTAASRHLRLSSITMSHLSTSGGKYLDDSEHCELEVNSRVGNGSSGGDTMFGRTICTASSSIQNNNGRSPVKSKSRRDTSNATIFRQQPPRASTAATATNGSSSSSAPQQPPQHNFYGADSSSPTFKTGAALFHTGETSKQRWGDIHMIRPSAATPPLISTSSKITKKNQSSTQAQDPDLEDHTTAPTNTSSAQLAIDNVVKSRTHSTITATNTTTTTQHQQKTLKPSAGIKHIKRRKGQSISLDFGISPHQQHDNILNYESRNTGGGYNVVDDDGGVTFDVEHSSRYSQPSGTTNAPVGITTTPTLPPSRTLKSPPPTPQLLMSLRQLSSAAASDHQQQQRRSHHLSRIQTPTSISPSPQSSKRGLLARKWITTPSTTTPGDLQGDDIDQQHRRITQNSRGGGVDGTSTRRELVPFLSTGALVESAMSGVGGTGSVAGGPRRFLDPFLHDARIYLSSELKLVDSSDGNSVLGVYREVFESLEYQFGRDGCGPLLRDIRHAYETRIGELEKIAQIALTGDPSLQREKERYLSCQEEALTAIERSIAHERTLRSRIVEAEQHGHQIEISVASELTDLRDTRVELSERAILDNAAIRDLQETLQTYSTVNQELRDRLDRADFDAMQKQEVNNHKIQEVRNELNAEKNKHMETQLRFEALERHRADEMAKLREECIEPKDYDVLKAHAKKLEESVRTLKRKLQWAEVEKGRLGASSHDVDGGGSVDTDNLTAIGSQPAFGLSSGM